MATEKVSPIEHLEHPSSEERKDKGETSEVNVHDKKSNRRLNRQLDIRILPLCCCVYLLNFLDRGDIPLHPFFELC